MSRTSLKCPKCGYPLKPQIRTRLGDPFEVPFRCEHCNTTWIWHSWQEYYESCFFEDLVRFVTKNFNPSIKGSTLKHES